MSLSITIPLPINELLPPAELFEHKSYIHGRPARGAGDD